MKTTQQKLDEALALVNEQRERIKELQDEIAHILKEWRGGIDDCKKKMDSSTDLDRAFWHGQWIAKERSVNDLERASLPEGQ